MMINISLNLAISSLVVVAPNDNLILPSIDLSDNPIAANTSFNLLRLDEQALVVDIIMSYFEKALTHTSPFTPGKLIFKTTGEPEVEELI